MVTIDRVLRSIQGLACWRMDLSGESSSLRGSVQLFGWKMVLSPCPVTGFLLFFVVAHQQETNHALKSLEYFPSAGKVCWRLCPIGASSPISIGKTFGMIVIWGSSPSPVIPS